MVIRWAVSTRAATWLLGLVARHSVGNPYGLSPLLIPSECTDRASTVVGSAVGMFTNWDGTLRTFMYYFKIWRACHHPFASHARAALCAGEYFVDIAVGGYEWDKMHAFYPLVPWIGAFISNVIGFFLSNVVCAPVRVGLSLFIVSNTSFIVASVLLFELGMAVFADMKLSYRAAVLFTLNPASVFMSAAYSESVFCVLSFGVLLASSRGHNAICAGLCLLCGLCRSNGVLLAAPVAISTGWRVLEKVDGRLWTSTCGVAAIICALLPYVMVHVVVAGVYCGTGHRDSMCRGFDVEQDNTVWAAVKALPGLGGTHMYSRVQSKYWGVGFLEHYKVKNAAGFLLAVPIVYVSIHGVFGLAMLCLRGRHGPFTRKQSIKMAPFVAYWGVISLVAVIYAHAPVATRLISTCPALYWWLSTEYFAEPGSRSWIAKAVRAWMALYFVLGPLAFCTFLPWT